MVQCTEVQCREVQCREVQCIVVQCTEVQCIEVGAERYSAERYSEVGLPVFTSPPVAGWAPAPPSLSSLRYYYCREATQKSGLAARRTWPTCTPTLGWQRPRCRPPTRPSWRPTQREGLAGPYTADLLYPY